MYQFDQSGIELDLFSDSELKTYNVKTSTNHTLWYVSPVE